MAEIRCIHRGRNKIGFFQDFLVKDPHWRKQTGWEPAPLPANEMPEQQSASQPDELHLKPALNKDSLANEIANEIGKAIKRQAIVIDEQPKKRGRKPKPKQTTA